MSAGSRRGAEVTTRLAGRWLVHGVRLSSTAGERLSVSVGERLRAEQAACTWPTRGTAGGGGGGDTVRRPTDRQVINARQISRELASAHLSRSRRFCVLSARRISVTDGRPVKTDHSGRRRHSDEALALVPAPAPSPTSVPSPTSPAPPTAARKWTAQRRHTQAKTPYLIQIKIHDKLRVQPEMGRRPYISGGRHPPPPPPPPPGAHTVNPLNC